MERTLKKKLSNYLNSNRVLHKGCTCGLNIILVINDVNNNKSNVEIVDTHVDIMMMMMLVVIMMMIIITMIMMIDYGEE